MSGKIKRFMSPNKAGGTFNLMPKQEEGE